MTPLKESAFLPAKLAMVRIGGFAPLGLPWLCLVLAMVCPLSMHAEAPSRKPSSKTDARYWLENMVVHHRYSTEEIVQATGLSPKEIQSYIEKWNLKQDAPAPRSIDERIRVLPYPGGRHPRIGFLDGAIDPQRETKISVFAPWDQASYAVLDIPEAIWSNLGLTYLAHTHIPTVWDRRQVSLEPQEWIRQDQGVMVMERTLPNGITFGTKVVPMKDHVRMTMWLQNDSDAELQDLRVQNCVLLKGMSGMNQISNDNKLFQDPYMACRSEDGRRWIITAWTPNHRTWANPPCPCMHSDPKFPDCAPGEKQMLKGWFSFYEGVDIIGEINRIDQLNWRD